MIIIRIIRIIFMFITFINAVVISIRFVALISVFGLKYSMKLQSTFNLLHLESNCCLFLALLMNYSIFYPRMNTD